jgi:hypothetical protein
MKDEIINTLTKTLTKIINSQVNAIDQKIESKERRSEFYQATTELERDLFKARKRFSLLESQQR